MVQLKDLFDPTLLEQHIKDGYVTSRTHRTLPLAVLNYTPKAAYEPLWDDVTRQCRGLIYDTETSIVYGRPYPKFFNYGQPEAAQIDLTDHVVCTDKLDGSLIVACRYKDSLVVATRGSFYSEQAVEARRIWLETDRYANTWPGDHETWLLEVIYPENRIVLDYGDARGLVLHGVIDNITGKNITDDVSTFWPNEATNLHYDSLADALAAPPRKNAEGIVVRRLSDDAMLKIKQDDYIAAHRIVTNLSDKALWEHLRDNDGTYDKLLDQVPDEFYTWLKDRADVFLDAYTAILDDVIEQFDRFSIGCHGDKKTFAGAVNTNRLAPILFAMWDKKPVGPVIWKSLKPKGERVE